MLTIDNCVLLSPVTCAPTEKISSAAKKLKKHRLRHLYVVDAKKNFLGIFSALDVLYDIVAAEKDTRKLSVKDAMKTEIVSFTKEDPLTKAIGFMSQTNVFSCPILEKGKLIGVLAYKDAMGAILKEKQRHMQEASASS